MAYKIVVVGLGYVGLPLAAAFSEKYKDQVLGFDINVKKIQELRQGVDKTESFTAEELAASGLRVTSDLHETQGAEFYIVTVPTPVGPSNRPDLGPVKGASEMIGKCLEPGAVICYESTVYPGVTEEICVPILEKNSGLECGKDFFVGYSPERINPGDKTNHLSSIVKVVSGQTPEIRDKLADLYGSIIDAGIFKVSSIRIAESAKVIENTQRDVNIALMNEFAKIFDHLGINTIEVLEAAQTKWNFLPFKPGLVGGHCIGVDPYYLTYKSEQLGYTPEIILASRRINDGMGKFVAAKAMKLMTSTKLDLRTAKVGIMGIAFKEDVPDIRNSRVADLAYELLEYGIDVNICDPFSDPEEVFEHYGFPLVHEDEVHNCDVLILAVAHEPYVKEGLDACVARMKNGRGIFMDLKSAFFHDSADLASRGVIYWAI